MENFVTTSSTTKISTRRKFPAIRYVHLSVALLELTQIDNLAPGFQPHSFILFWSCWRSVLIGQSIACPITLANRLLALTWPCNSLHLWAYSNFCWQAPLLTLSWAGLNYCLIRGWQGFCECAWVKLHSIISHDEPLLCFLSVGWFGHPNLNIASDPYEMEYWW